MTLVEKLIEISSEQATRIEELESTIKLNLPHFKYAIDCLTKEGINPGPLTDIYKALLNTQDTQEYVCTNTF